MRAMAGTHRDHSAVLIRLAYILGNLTTNFESARLELNKLEAKSIQTMMELSVYYMRREANPEGFKPQLTDKGKAKYEEFTQGNLEDTLTKVIKLIANLSTDENAA